MTYEVVDPYSEEEVPDRPCQTHAVTGNRSPAGRFEQLGVRIYDAEPGEQLPLHYHYHDEQEEAFYVLAGELHAETPEGEIVAGEGEVFLVKPGNPHRVFNPEDAEAALRVLGMGAPSYNSGNEYVPEDE